MSSGVLVGADIERYRVSLAAQQMAPATIKAKITVLTALAAWADVAELEDLTREDVEAWLVSRPLARWSRLKYLDHIRGWCRWAHVDDITDGIRRPPTPPAVPRPAPEAAVAALLSHADPRVRVWTALGAYCGLRSMETAKVAVEDLEAGGDGTALLRVLGKGDQLALVPLADIVGAELTPWISATRTGRLWPEAKPHTVQSAIKRAAAELGFELTSHQLRHRYGTAFYAESRDLLLTRNAMRHRSAASTEIYVEVGASRAAAVIAKLPGASVPAASGRPALRVIRGGRA